MTKGQRNELKRQQYEERYAKVKSYGYSIKEHRMGPKDYIDSYSYYIHKHGICIHNGCYDYHESALEVIEDIINKENEETREEKV